ncbi:MAG: hypothetical protein RR396_06470 [Clostridiales bacterium]
MLSFDYTLCGYNNNDIFYGACKKIEQAILDIKKEKLLIDVDDSLLQKYILDGKRIIVQNDFEVGAVYIQSDIDLSALFTQ